MRFYLNFGFLGFKIVNKGKMNLFKGSEDFRFSNFNHSIAFLDVFISGTNNQNLTLQT